MIGDVAVGVGTAATLYLSFFMNSGALPAQQSTVTMQVVNTLGKIICTSSFVVTVAGDPCPFDVIWEGSTVDAVHDGASCYVHAVPAGDGTPFVYGNNYYVSTGPNGFCEAGAFDGGNCFLGSAPSGRTGFLWGSSFYYSP